MCNMKNHTIPRYPMLMDRESFQSFMSLIMCLERQNNEAQHFGGFVTVVFLASSPQPLKDRKGCVISQHTC